MFAYLLKRSLLLILSTGTILSAAWAQTTKPSALTTASTPVLAPSGSPASPFSSMPSSMTTLGLPSTAKLKEQKDAYISSLMPDLGLKIKQLKKTKDRKKKVSKTDYEGLSMIKAYTKLGSGDRTIVEEFYVLKDNDAAKPLPYVREVFRYYPRDRRVTSSVVRDGSTGLLLHGPYKRFQNGELMEEGYYYAGMKDGRWERYDSKFTLLDKVFWHRGIPAESRVTYYDSSHHKVKEIIPMEYGKVKGTYMAFHENGLLAEEGKYDNGVKIGRWTEFYPISPSGRRMRHKLTQHGSDQWDKDFDSYVITEWDEKGKVIFEHTKEKVVEADESDN